MGVDTAPGAVGARGIWRDRLLVGVGAAAVVAAYAVLALPASIVDRYVEEDGVIEWVGALGLLTGAGLFLWSFLLVRTQAASAAAGMSRHGVWVLLALAGALFVAGGEEISWAQRLLGISTPEAISAINEQDETTLHNLTPFQSGALDGDRLFKLAWLSLFVLVPLAATAWPRAGAWLRRTVPVVPLALSALFVLAWVAAQVADPLLSGSFDSLYPLGHALAEVQEGVVEVLAGIGALLTLLRLRQLVGRPPR